MTSAWSRDTTATSSLIGLLVALGVFTVSMTAIVQVSTNDAQREDETTDRAGLEVAAANLADQLLGSPGSGWYAAGDACDGSEIDPEAFTPESVTLLGLAEEVCANPGAAGRRVSNLSYDKLANLQEGKMVVDASDDAVDYEEARKALGLDVANLNFHIRSYPILPDVDRLISEGSKDPNMRPAYIGNYIEVGGSGGSSTGPPHAKGVKDNGDYVTVYVNVTNNGASPAPFGVWFQLPLKDNNPDFTLHTPVIAVDGYYNVSFNILKTNDWEWHDPTEAWVNYQISHKDGGFDSATIPLSISMTAASSNLNVFVEASKLWYKRPSGSIETKFHYEAYDGKGKSQTFTDWTAQMYKPDASIEATWVLPNGKSGDESRDIGVDGTLTVKLHNDALTTVWNEDRINVLNADPSAYVAGTPVTGYTLGPAVLPEAKIIEFLVSDFDPNPNDITYNTAELPFAADGDVFADVKKSLEQDLYDALTDSSGDPTLDQYNMLVVGTGVDQREMTPAAIKNTIADWVLAGGTLIVFGTEDGHDNWLRAVYHVALQGVGNGISIPDHNHPVLKTPNDLDVLAYDYHGTAWNLNGPQTADIFTHVVKAGTDDVLAVSNPGTLGKGRVILTSWWPYDPIAGDPPLECQPATLSSSCAGMMMLDNFMTLGYSDLYLDYGPLIPDDVSQGAQSQIAVVWHPELQKLVELQILVYVWG